MLWAGVNDAGGRTKEPTDFTAGYAKFNEAARTTFRPDAAAGETNARTDILTLLGKQEAAVDNVTGTVKAGTALLDGQHLTTPDVGDDVTAYANKATSFLNGVADDFKKLGDWKGRVNAETGVVDESEKSLKAAMTKYKWSEDDLKSADPEAYAKVKTSMVNLQTSQGKFLDATQGYGLMVENKSKAALDGWDATEKKQAKKEDMALVNAFLDISTAMGIGGNAISQIALKEAKAGAETLDRMTNLIGLRGGQIGDMVQAYLNTGNTFTNLNSTTLSGALSEVSATDARVGQKLTDLTQRVTAFREQWEDDRFEGKIGGF